MIALIRIELDEKHLAKETNEIYDRLQGYNSVLMPLPEKMNETEYMQKVSSDGDWYEQVIGWNKCVDEIAGENE